MALLPNGSARQRRPAQVLELQQHPERALELAVEVDLVAAESIQLFRVERLAERLLPDQRAMSKLARAVCKPSQNLFFDKAAEA